MNSRCASPGVRASSSRKRSTSTASMPIPISTTPFHALRCRSRRRCRRQWSASVGDRLDQQVDDRQRRRAGRRRRRPRSRSPSRRGGRSGGRSPAARRASSAAGRRSWKRTCSSVMPGASSPPLTSGTRITRAPVAAAPGHEHLALGGDAALGAAQLRVALDPARRPRSDMPPRSTTPIVALPAGRRRCGSG